MWFPQLQAWGQAQFEWGSIVGRDKRIKINEINKEAKSVNWKCVFVKQLARHK